VVPEIPTNGPFTAPYVSTDVIFSVTDVVFEALADGVPSAAEELVVEVRILILLIEAPKLAF